MNTKAGAGWRVVSAVADIAKRTYMEFADDRIAAVAGGVTFFGLLALFPAIASIVSLYGLFADRSTIKHTVDALAPYVPGGAISVIDMELTRLVAEKPGKLNLAFLASTAIALWSASGGIKALIDGLNVAFDRKETRSFLKLTGHALLFAAAGIVAVVIVAYFSVIVPGAIGRFAHPHAFVLAFYVVRWPAVFVVAALLLGLIYRIGPNRPHAPWISWGGAIGAVFLILGTLSFGWYVQTFGSYDRTYGSLGAVVGFLTWIWISLVILLTGAELDSEIERRRRARARS